MRRPLMPLLLATLLLAAPGALAAETALWRATIDSGPLGPVELYLETSLDGETLRGASRSGSLALLRDIPGEHNVETGLFAFSAQRADDGTFAGPVLSPWRDGTITLQLDGDVLRGHIDAGIFAGTLSAAPAAEVVTLRDYAAVLHNFDAVVARRIFSPDDLRRPGYIAFRERLGLVAANAVDDLDLLFGFRWLWNNDPFSHFELRRSAQTAEQLFAYFDTFRVGFEAATVAFDGDVAVLTVRTMMGADTIEQIEAAFERIAERQPSALVIDLRGNGGGAFAVKPLVEHVIDEPVDAGYFFSQVWNREHDAPPTASQALSSPPWEGWSIVGFWRAVQEADIVRIRFVPAEPNFDGPVYVLLDGRSASATEMAADALRSAGVATFVGRSSAGEMLSQSLFDVGDGFIVSLPVADYYSMAHGRIEGNGVPVDITIDPEQALDEALRLIQNPASDAD